METKYIMTFVPSLKPFEEDKIPKINDTYLFGMSPIIKACDPKTPIKILIVNTSSNAAALDAIYNEITSLDNEDIITMRTTPIKYTDLVDLFIHEIKNNGNKIILDTRWLTSATHKRLEERLVEKGLDVCRILYDADKNNITLE